MRDSTAAFGETDVGGLLAAPDPDLRRDGRLAGVALRPPLLQPGHGEGHARHRLVASCSTSAPQLRCAGDGAVVDASRGRIGGEPTYCFEGIINYSAATLAWLKDQLGLIRIADETEPLRRVGARTTAACTSCRRSPG